MSTPAHPRQPAGTPTGGRFATAARTEPGTVLEGRHVNTERVGAIQAAISGVVLDAHPDAAGWVAATTARSGGRHAWVDAVQVLTPEGGHGPGVFTQHRLALSGTAAHGALDDGLNTHLPAQGPERHRVALTGDFPILEDGVYWPNGTRPPATATTTGNLA